MRRTPTQVRNFRTHALGPSWQSLLRRTSSIETDCLNGEVVLLGCLHGVATPVNALLQRLANRLAKECREPASISPDAFDRLLRAEHRIG